MIINYLMRSMPMSVTQVVTAILIPFMWAFEMVSYALFILQAIKIFSDARPLGFTNLNTLRHCTHVIMRGSLKWSFVLPLQSGRDPLILILTVKLCLMKTTMEI